MVCTFKEAPDPHALAVGRWLRSCSSASLNTTCIVPGTCQLGPGQSPAPARPAGAHPLPSLPVHTLSSPTVNDTMWHHRLPPLLLINRPSRATEPHSNSSNAPEARWRAACAASHHVHHAPPKVLGLLRCALCCVALCCITPRSSCAPSGSWPAALRFQCSWRASTPAWLPGPLCASGRGGHEQGP